MNDIIYYVENYFQGYQLIAFDWPGMLSWFDRDANKQRYERATLGM